MRVRCAVWMLLLVVAAGACPLAREAPPQQQDARPSAQEARPTPTPSPRGAASDTFSAGVMYWATPLPVLCRDWYVVLGGTVIETHREVIPELAKQRYTAGTLKVERVFLSLPTEKEPAPAGFTYFKSDGFEGLRRGDKVIVFVGEYDGGYGIVEAAGSNSKLGIKVRSWDEPIVKAVEALTRDPQGARLPGDRVEDLRDPARAKVWRPFDGKGAAGRGCLP